MTADGRGVASHAGSRLLADLAEVTGLVDEFSGAVASLRQRRSGHDPGRVLVDLAVMLADGGEAISDLGVLRDQPELFGSVASTATAWRVLDGVDESTLRVLRIGRTYESEPVLERLIDHPDVLPKVQGLLGDRFVLQAGWNTMQPAHAGNGRWHQDGSSAFDFKDLGFPVLLLQLRVSYLLTDQTVPGMGNMELIPGSHRSRVDLPDSIRERNDDIAIGHVVCAEAGAALVFHNGVWHRTFRHDGDYDRYTTHYVYSPPWIRMADRFNNDPEFLERTTPLRRTLMGEFARPDAPFGANYDPLPI